MIFRRVDFSHEDVLRYRDQLRSIFAGSVEFAAFETVDWGKSHGSYDWSISPERSVEHLLLSEAVREAFTPDYPSFPSPLGKEVEICWRRPLEFTGLLADILNSGGMYGSYRDLPESPVLAAACVRGILTLDPTPYWWPWYVSGRWSQFFCDVASDHTFIVNFQQKGRWFIMCATDTD